MAVRDQLLLQFLCSEVENSAFQFQDYRIPLGVSRVQAM